MRKPNKKKCTKCGETKLFSAFYKQASAKIGYRSQCKSCEREYTKKKAKELKAYKRQYYLANKESILAQCREYRERPENKKRKAAGDRAYYLKNKEKITKYKKKWCKDNFARTYARFKERLRTDPSFAEDLKKYRKKYATENAESIKTTKAAYYQKNKKEIRKKGKKYYHKNKSWLLEKSKKYMRRRYASDVDYKLIMTIRGHANRLARAVKQKKKLRSIEYLGCPLKHFKTHIEKQWQKGMSWQNHQADGWHLDHKIPISWFVKNSDDPWKANHFLNLQPLWAADNLTKKATVDKKTLKKVLKQIKDYEDKQKS